MFNTPVPITIGSASRGTDRTVRPAVLSDAEAIGNLQHAALLSLIRRIHADDDFSGDVVPPVEVVREYWQETLSQTAPAGCATFVAIHGNQVVGFALALAGEAIPEIPGKREEIQPGTDIAELQIHADFRRSGHASRLLQAMVDTLNAPNLRIWIADFDDARQRLVQSAGFAPSGVRRRIEIGNHTVTQHLWWATTG